ncbi:pseudouridine synthase [Clostridia bacterium]|nr:pseudouridine synthase [Clostridia bacterium]
MNDFYFIVEDSEIGQRLDKFLAEHLQNKTRSTVQNYIDSDFVKVNGKAQRKNYKLRIGEAVNINIPDPVELKTTAENIPIDILYEDDSLLVVNKPKGMVVHPAVGNYTGTLVNALLHHCSGRLSGINGVMRPGIVHRIDKDTSGLLVVAKTDIAHNGLAEQIKVHSFTRQYQAVVYGNIKTDKGTVDQPIGRKHDDRKKMAVTDKNSRSAITHYEVLERFGTFTHLKITLETGRTHQIRVHMSYLNHPVAGDIVYGPKKVIISLHGQCLHAAKFGFVHPVSNQYLEFEAPLPDYFTSFLKQIKSGHNF